VPDPISLESFRAAHRRLAPYVLRTASARWCGGHAERYLGPETDLHLKLELFQRTGTFKARGAINNILALAAPRRVTAVSAGNHAIAVAYAAAALDADAKIVVQDTANPARLAAARQYGADIVLEPPGPGLFRRAQEIVEREGRAFVHPFEGPRVSEATAGVALEFLEDVGELDALVVAIGGGGLASGVAAATKLLQPTCAVYGVEPAGAAVMRESLKAGRPLDHFENDTIADSLAPPMTTPFAFDTCRRYVDELITVTDDQIAATLYAMFMDTKLAVEPAGAAAAAAVFSVLRERLRRKRVGIVVCGSNIDPGTFGDYLVRGRRAMERDVLDS